MPLIHFEFGPWSCMLHRTTYVPDGSGGFVAGWEAQALLNNEIDEQAFAVLAGDAVEGLANILVARIAEWASLPASVCLDRACQATRPRG